MDTTVALFFSLGLVMGGPADQEAATPAPESSSQTVIAQKTTSTKASKVQRRIVLTNQWLAQQKQARRAQLVPPNNTKAKHAGKRAGTESPGAT